MPRLWTIFLFICCIRLQTDASPTTNRQSIQHLRTQILQAENRLQNEMTHFYNMISPYFIGHNPTTHSSVESEGCGLTADHHTALKAIIGGRDAFAYSWPWMVALFKESAQVWHCGAVLINSNTILTAAHCVENVTSEQIKPVLGVHTLTTKRNALNYRKVSAIHQHPNYTGCCKNDVAILKLAKHVTYGPKINRVCLPFPVQDYSRMVNETVTVIGWGTTERGVNTTSESVQKLQQGNVKLFSDSRCQKDHGALFLSETQFCAGDYRNRTDTMKGDSGGPLLMQSSDSEGRWTVLGLTSYKSNQTKNATGVYVKLSAFEQFIKSHL